MELRAGHTLDLLRWMELIRWAVDPLEISTPLAEALITLSTIQWTVVGCFQNHCIHAILRHCDGTRLPFRMAGYPHLTVAALTAVSAASSEIARRVRRSRADC